MSNPTRGVLYLVWGDTIEPYVQRSIASLKVHHPSLPVHVERVTPRDPNQGRRFCRQLDTADLFSIEIRAGSPSQSMGTKERGTRYG